MVINENAIGNLHPWILGREFVHRRFTNTNENDRFRMTNDLDTGDRSLGVHSDEGIYRLAGIPRNVNQVVGEKDVTKQLAPAFGCVTFPVVVNTLEHRCAGQHVREFILVPLLTERNLRF